MASPRKPPKQSAGWGGLLQQAVLSVESKLDTILADEEQQSAKATTSSGAQDAARRASTDISRSSSAARTNDRLQERLARAMAKKKSEGRNDSPASISDSIARTATPIDTPGEGRTEETASRASTDNPRRTEIPAISMNEAEVIGAGLRDSEHTDEAKPSDLSATYEGQAAETPVVSETATPPRISLDEVSRSRTPDIVINGTKGPHEGASAEDMYTYIEKIDALQAKLQYLTREAAASARDAAAAAKNGSVEKKLFERDEKIALLMDEGQKLSKTEMKHLMVIKKLRSQAAESAKSQSSIKARAEKAEASLSSAEQRAERAEAAMRKAEENLGSSLDADRDTEAVKHERDALSATVAEIRSQLAQANKRAELAEDKARSEVLERDRKLVAELKDDLTSARVEREISEEKLRREIRDLKASLEREKERSKALEVELRAEQSFLENRMESLRNRAEEASSSNVGDSQAKLLRQIETLQQQHAIASQNWQGIESSLLARITHVEKEREDIEHRESDLRKKAREATMRSKHADKENEASKNAVYQLEQALSEQKTKVRHLQREAKETDELLSQMRKDLETQQQRHEAKLLHRIEEERNKWKEHTLMASPTVHRNDSPIGSLRKSPGHGLGLEHMSGSFTAERSHSRRPTVLPPSFRNSNTPPRQNSSASLQPSLSGAVPETPASQDMYQDNYFPEPPTPASLGTHRGVNELMSVSTFGAGPSVQLVERMSASVRRLESEKAASKDELTRLTAQRDESRKEVVSLMREVEQKRASDERIKALEAEITHVNERHQTTLEMLGEKSELVEELKADVADIKQMYRDLVDSTMNSTDK